MTKSTLIGPSPFTASTPAPTRPPRPSRRNQACGRSNQRHTPLPASKSLTRHPQVPGQLVEKV